MHMYNFKMREDPCIEICDFQWAARPTFPEIPSKKASDANEVSKRVGRAKEFVPHLNNSRPKNWL